MSPCKINGNWKVRPSDANGGTIAMGKFPSYPHGGMHKSTREIPGKPQ